MIQIIIVAIMVFILLYLFTRKKQRVSILRDVLIAIIAGIISTMIFNVSDHIYKIKDDKKGILQAISNNDNHIGDINGDNNKIYQVGGDLYLDKLEEESETDEFIEITHPDEVEIEDYHLWTEIDALSSLYYMGFTDVEIEYVYDGVTLNGMVLSTDPVAGNVVPYGSKIKLIVGKGKYE